ncbi:hypothetical protein [Actinomadura macrotermitis]|uniref:Uncharacterized protein n=1 Tax=Actinomadura macrotermitis TaxID=2585200 RepID=A0A7K0BZ01_9ACTN|nr:hypothetical protein [Actinomadura macrotermitis]MQY06400.1 hypothetical protein [Actinomadura macrotermitis]
MSEATFHLTHPQLHGPAERTLVEPRLSAMSNPALNAYAEAPPLVPGGLSLVEILSAAPQPAHHPHALAA